MPELEPLDERLQRLFAEDRKAFDRRASGKELALHAVEQRALLAGLGALSAASPQAAVTAGATRAGVSAIAGKTVVVLALVFSAGFGAGMLARGLQSSPVAPVATLVLPPSPVLTSPTTPSESPVTLVQSTAASLPTATAAPSAPAPAQVAASPSSLAAERDLVDTARAALSRGRANDALAAVQTHASRFPNGALAEEREALAVQALVIAGRVEAARERGAKFHRRYPKSIFGSSVDAILRKGAKE
jgi:TolA-binding protein